MLIALHKVLGPNNTTRVLVNPQFIYQVIDEGEYTVVYTYSMTRLVVTETMEQIEELVSSKTQSRGEIAE